MQSKNDGSVLPVCLSVCVFVCGSALLQPARSVCVASEYFFILMFTLCGKLSGAVYCYRSCLFATGARVGGRCGFVGLLPR